MVLVSNAHSCYIMTYYISSHFVSEAKVLGMNIYEENEDFFSIIGRFQLVEDQTK